MKKKRTLFIVILVLAAALGWCVLQYQSPEEQIQSRIDGSLEALGVQNAQSLGQMEHRTNRDNSLMYYGDGMYYYFEPGSGQLAQIRHETLVDPDAPGWPDDPVEMDAARREQLACELAEKCLTGQVFGRLELTPSDYDGVSYGYTFRETYDGFRTGTYVSIQMLPDGTVITCDMDIGSLFKRTLFGGYVLARGDDFVSREEAMEAAVGYLKENDIGIYAAALLMDTARCTLSNSADQMYYVVKIAFMDGDYERLYTARVDAYTGEVLEALGSM